MAEIPEKVKDIHELRKEFEDLIVAESAGKSLGKLVRTGRIYDFLGEKFGNITGRSMNQLAVLINNIEKTKPIKDRRLGLFYICFEKKQAIEAIDYLEYDPQTTKNLYDALKHLDHLCFLATKPELKGFISHYGAECYDYLDGLSKAQRNVYDLSNTKILSRHYMMNEIRAHKEPIFIEDLNIDKDDLRKNKIADGEKADAILKMLLGLVHKQPGLNLYDTLLAQAKSYSKNPFMTLDLKIRQMRRR